MELLSGVPTGFSLVGGWGGDCLWKALFQALAAAKLDWEVWRGWAGLWYTSGHGVRLVSGSSLIV